MVAIPGGITSPDGTLGIIRLATGLTLALDLSNGEVIWKARASALPIAATSKHVILATVGTSIAVEVRDLSSGELVELSSAVLLPDDLRQVETQPDSIEFRILETPDSIELSWHMQRMSIGGTLRRDDEFGSIDGSVVLPVASPVGAIPRAASAEPPDASSIFAVTPSNYAPLAGELSRKEIGDTHYIMRLVTEADGGKAVMMQSLPVNGARPNWEVKLDKILNIRGPYPLRK